jgi:hypothetical protein
LNAAIKVTEASFIYLKISLDQGVVNVLSLVSESGNSGCAWQAGNYQLRLCFNDTAAVVSECTVVLTSLRSRSRVLFNQPRIRQLNVPNGGWFDALCTIKI